MREPKEIFQYMYTPVSLLLYLSAQVVELRHDVLELLLERVGDAGARAVGPAVGAAPGPLAAPLVVALDPLELLLDAGGAAGNVLHLVAHRLCLS
jgi:hypothetical protein